ncbi:MAG: YraN family protein [Pseudochelatococcus sp.]|jgi:putative endonuclease|uniref:YraN family protein n=1 Tax=Pseudochelatococcus sp. TaxID=2020869 RepID=UPI003D8EA94E
MTRRTADARRAATHDAGLQAERLAAFLLMLKGYRILSRRYRAGGGEIDIVAQRGNTVAFVEVKARAALDDARQAITADKQRRIVGAVRHWLARNAWAMPMTLRCDAVFVGRKGLPRHVRDVMTLYLD